MTDMKITNLEYKTIEHQCSRCSFITSEPYIEDMDDRLDKEVLRQEVNHLRRKDNSHENTLRLIMDRYNKLKAYMITRGIFLSPEDIEDIVK